MWVDLLVRQLFDVEAFVSSHVLKFLGERLSVLITRLLIIITLFQRHTRLHLRKIESIWKQFTRDLRKTLRIRAHRTLQSKTALTWSLRGDLGQTLCLNRIQYFSSSLSALMGSLATISEYIQIVSFCKLLGSSYIFIIIYRGRHTLCIFKGFQLLVFEWPYSGARLHTCCKTG